MSFTARSKSFMDHIEDVYKEDIQRNNRFNQATDNDDLKKAPSSLASKQAKYNSTKWWNQTLLLVIEIIQITGTVNKYRSERLTTEVIH